MENKKFELPLTAQALGELSATVAALTSGLRAKREELQAKSAAQGAAMAQKEQALAELQGKTAAALQNMDNIISQIDNVLEKDGSGNDNN